MSIKRIGILGGGQLAQMLALAGIPLGLEFVIFEPSSQACAQLCAQHICAEYKDTKALEEFANAVDVITYEFENVPTSVLDYLESKCPIHPNRKALRISQDRLIEKQFFQSLGLSLPEYAEVNSVEELEKGTETTGSRAILKTRRFGYDGKGQLRIGDGDDLEQAWKEFGEKPAVMEQMVSFSSELSMIAVRSEQGEIAYYPLFQNQHHNGILRRTDFPSASVEHQKKAQSMIKAILEKLDYVGVLTLELFVVDGELLINEMAPRVHNSGHLTIEGARTSQFENHLRAVAGLPLGSPSPLGVSAMINIVGTPIDRESVMAKEGCHYHDYAKEPRAGRKIGHVTINADTLEECARFTSEVEAIYPADSQ